MLFKLCMLCCYMMSVYFTAGSYVALTLLGKPSQSRDSLIEREPLRENSVSGPQPVDVSN